MTDNNNFSITCKDAGVIVEIGGNHEGDIDYAYKLVDSAISAGAQSIKLQSYTANSLVNNKLNPDRAKHFEKFTLPYHQQIDIAKYIASKGAMFMSSLWDLKSLELLESEDKYKDEFDKNEVYTAKKRAFKGRFF